jgi:inward rectifier potassium channel
VVALAGVDDTTLQPVHASQTYGHRAIAWGERLADVLSEQPDGNLILDLRRFHDTEPVPPSESFPYPATGSAA